MQRGSDWIISASGGVLINPWQPLEKATTNAALANQLRQGHGPHHHLVVELKRVRAGLLWRFVTEKPLVFPPREEPVECDGDERDQPKSERDRPQRYL